MEKEKLINVISEMYDEITSMRNEIEELRLFKAKAEKVMNQLWVENKGLKTAVDALKRSGVGKYTSKPRKAITEAVKGQIRGIFDARCKGLNENIQYDGDFCIISPIGVDGSEYAATEKQIQFLSKLVSTRSNMRGLSKWDAAALIDVAKETKLTKPQITVNVIEKKQQIPTQLKDEDLNF